MSRLMHAKGTRQQTKENSQGQQNAKIIMSLLRNIGGNVVVLHNAPHTFENGSGKALTFLVQRLQKVETLQKWTNRFTTVKNPHLLRENSSHYKLRKRKRI